MGRRIFRPVVTVPRDLNVVEVPGTTKIEKVEEIVEVPHVVQIEKVVPEVVPVTDQVVVPEVVWHTRRVEKVIEVPQPAPLVEKRQKGIVVEKRVLKPDKIVTPKTVWKDVVEQR